MRRATLNGVSIQHDFNSFLLILLIIGGLLGRKLVDRIIACRNVNPKSIEMKSRDSEILEYVLANDITLRIYLLYKAYRYSHIRAELETSVGDGLFVSL